MSRRVFLCEGLKYSLEKSRMLIGIVRDLFCFKYIDQVLKVSAS